ncbi:MAG: TetR/AcrR family transcriptional regulator [Myxococcota bacterium]
MQPRTQQPDRPEPVRRERGERRRRKILEATLRVIARGGVAGLTHRAVAAEADVPLASTTYYFATKLELLLEACRFHSQRMEARFDAIEAQLEQTEPTPGRLAAALTRILSAQLYPSHADLLAEYELVLEAARREELRSLAQAWSLRMRRRIARWLRRAGSTDPATDAAIVLAVVSGADIENLSVGYGPDQERVLRRALARLLRKLLASAPRSGL